MTPVISPLVFYAMSVVDVLKILFIVLGAGTSVAALILIIVTISMGMDYGKNDEDYLQFKALTKPVIVFATVTVMLATFIPSENTITKMIVAQNVTYERVETVTDTVESVYNDIMELFEEG